MIQPVHCKNVLIEDIAPFPQVMLDCSPSALPYALLALRPVGESARGASAEPMYLHCLSVQEDYAVSRPLHQEELRFDAYFQLVSLFPGFGRHPLEDAANTPPSDFEPSVLNATTDGLPTTERLSNAADRAPSSAPISQASLLHGCLSG